MPSVTRLIILQAAIVVSALIYNVYSKYYDNTPCSKDFPISLTSTKQQREYSWTDSCQLFSLSYEEARGKFLQILQTYDNVERLSFPIAMENGHEPLTIDVAIFPGNTAEYGTIVHSSGLHGVEGYAGSAIQLALLQKEVLPLSSGNNNRPTFVFLHSLNPVGMKEYRRFNENNVDLNRNSIQGDFDEFIARRDPDIANYDKFRRFLSPTDPDSTTTGTSIDPTSWYSSFGIWWNLLPHLYQYGVVALKRAMVSGQYHHPKGIFYGGGELQPSIQTLREFWNSRPDLFQNAPSMVWIDVHTGLGPFGKDSLHCHPTFPENGAQTSHIPSTAAELHEVFSTSHSVITSVSQSETDDAFAGYDLTEGMLMPYFSDIYTGSGLFMTQEFGTLPAILVGRGLILDNMLYQQHLTTNVGNVEGEQVEQSSYQSPYLGDVFYPQSSSWRSSIVKRGVALMLQCIELSKP
jgi:hypothetical protein